MSLDYYIRLIEEYDAYGEIPRFYVYIPSSIIPVAGPFDSLEDADQWIAQREQPDGLALL
jgi:hypothetical protein